MALLPKSIFLASAFALALLHLAFCPSAGAVTLKQRISGKAVDNPAFVQTSLAAASRAEITSAIQAELQQLVAQEIASQLAEEMLESGDVMDNVKALAGDAMGTMLDSIKDSMTATCKRLADIAQAKMDDLDGKLQQIAERDVDEDDSEEPDVSDARRHAQQVFEEGKKLGYLGRPDGPADGPGVSDAMRHAQQVIEDGKKLVSQGTDRPDRPDVSDARRHAQQVFENGKKSAFLDTKRVAWLQLQIRDKHKGWFDNVKSMVKRGLKKAKGFMKEGANTLWGAVKPAVARGLQVVTAKLSAKVPDVINSACESAEEKVDKVQSKVMQDAGA